MAADLGAGFIGMTLIHRPLLDDSSPLPTTAPFTTEQARAAGIGPNQLTRLVAEGLIRRLLKRVYVAAQAPDTLELRAEALSLVVPPGSVVTDRTAGWLHGADVLAPNDHLQVPSVQVYREAGRARVRTALSTGGERTFMRQDLTVVRGLAVTTPLRTAWDLGRLLPRDQALGGLDAMLRLQAFSRLELLAGLERFAKQRGVVQLRELAPLADGRSQSMGESTLRLRWLDQRDLPRPALQIPILAADGREIFYLDLGIPELRLAAEYDGQRWHGPEQEEHDSQRRAWIRRERGWMIEVFRRDDVYGQHEDAGSRLREKVYAARRRLGLTPWDGAGSQ